MREVVKACADRTDNRSAAERVEALRKETTLFIQRREKAQAAERGREKKKIIDAIRGVEDALGRGVRARAGGRPNLTQALRATIEQTHQRLLAELDEILAQEDLRYLRKRGIGAHAEDRPTKATFTALRETDPTKSLPIEEVIVGGDTISDSSELADSAGQHFSARFQQQYDHSRPEVRQARDDLLRRVRRLPQKASDNLLPENFLTEARIAEAIRSLPLAKAPGLDGFPADWYRAYAKEIAPLLRDLYLECMHDGQMTDLMKSAVISMIYKGKGLPRTEWKSYRPVSVSALEYKILTKTMTLAMADELQHIIGPDQVGFQKGKYIGEAIALAQLSAAYCAKQSSPGLLLFHDGELAYDLVQWDWLQEVMTSMNIPKAFRDMVGLIFTDTTSQVKVNGVLSPAFSLRNGVKQGCPLSPYLYIISLQPLLDAIAADGAIRGVSIPGQGGMGESEARCMAYADDLAIYLSAFASLPRVAEIVRTYNMASGADTNWRKCDGLRLGSLRGQHVPHQVLTHPSMQGMTEVRWRDLDSTQIHAGCDCEVAPTGPPHLCGKKVIAVNRNYTAWEVQVGTTTEVVREDDLHILPTRYLGIYLGSPEAVQRRWDTHVSGTLTDALAALTRVGVPRTISGRVLGQKNLAIAKVVFQLTNQSPPQWNQPQEAWQQQLTDFLWTTRAGDEREAAGQQRNRPPALVTLDAIAQDHSNGGARALIVQDFADALRATWVRKLLDPTPQPWKNLVWGGINSVYGHLRMGERILLSTVTFHDLTTQSGLPPVFVNALKAWGRLPTPQPKAGGTLKREALSSPLYYDPSEAPEALEPNNQEHVASLRQAGLTQRSVELRNRHREIANQLAASGMHTVADLTPFIDIRPPDHRGHRAVAIQEDRLPAQWRTRQRVAILRSVTSQWSQNRLKLLAGPAPDRLQEGEWVSWQHQGVPRKYGRITSAARQQGGSFKVDVYTLDTTHTLRKTGQSVRVPPHWVETEREHFSVWEEGPPEPRQRADGLDPNLIQNTILQMRPKKPHVFRLKWCTTTPTVNPQRWLVMGAKTLAEPEAKSLVTIQSHHIHAALLSRRFHTGNAYPRAFAEGGCWRRLLPPHPATAEGERARSKAVREVFTDSRNSVRCTQMGSRENLQVQGPYRHKGRPVSRWQRTAPTLLAGP